MISRILTINVHGLVTSTDTGCALGIWADRNDY